MQKSKLKHDDIILKNPEILSFPPLPNGQRMQYSYDIGTGEIYSDVVPANTRVLYDDPFVVYVMTTGKAVSEEEFKGGVSAALLKRRQG